MLQDLTPTAEQEHFWTNSSALQRPSSFQPSLSINMNVQMCNNPFVHNCDWNIVLTQWCSASFFQLWLDPTAAHSWNLTKQSERSSSNSLLTSFPLTLILSSLPSPECPPPTCSSFPHQPSNSHTCNFSSVRHPNIHITCLCFQPTCKLPVCLPTCLPVSLWSSYASSPSNCPIRVLFLLPVWRSVMDDVKLKRGRRVLLNEYRHNGSWWKTLVSAVFVCRHFGSLKLLLLVWISCFQLLWAAASLPALIQSETPWTSDSSCTSWFNFAEQSTSDGGESSADSRSFGSSLTSCCWVHFIHVESAQRIIHLKFSHFTNNTHKIKMSRLKVRNNLKNIICRPVRDVSSPALFFIRCEWCFSSVSAALMTKPQRINTNINRRVKRWRSLFFLSLFFFYQPVVSQNELKWLNRLNWKSCGSARRRKMELEGLLCDGMTQP